MTYGGAVTSLPLNAIPGEIVFCVLTKNVMMYDGNRWVPVAASEEWNLFIDDIRLPGDVDLPDAWDRYHIRIARTVQSAISLIETYGLPDRISFDHDLGQDQPPGTQLMWHIINGHLDEKWNCSKMKGVVIHSVNTPGAENLLKLWQGFCQAHYIVMDTRWRPALK